MLKWMIKDIPEVFDAYSLFIRNTTGLSQTMGKRAPFFHLVSPLSLF